jgi:hypothetical protein
MTAPLDGLLVVGLNRAGRPARHDDARRPRRSGDRDREPGGRRATPRAGDRRSGSSCQAFPGAGWIPERRTNQRRGQIRFNAYAVALRITEACTSARTFKDRRCRR